MKNIVIVEDNFLIYDQTKTFVIKCKPICYHEMVNVVLPKTVKYINKRAFEKARIQSLDASACSFLIIDDLAFLDCKDMTDITLPNFGKIGHQAFSGCCALAKFTLPVFLTYSTVETDSFDGWDINQEILCLPYIFQTEMFAKIFGDEDDERFCLCLNGGLVSINYQNVDGDIYLNCTEINDYIVKKFLCDNKDTIQTLSNLELNTKIEYSKAFKDILVYSTTHFKCRNFDHLIRDVDIFVPLIKPDGKETEVRVLGGYCPNCGTYFITTNDYNRLKQQGRITCRVMESKRYYEDSEYSFLQSESIIFQYGYNVKQSEGLSAKERQDILKTVIADGVLSNHEIRTHLEWLINNSKGRQERTLAISKWEEDLAFLRNYRAESNLNYRASSIRHIHYELR